MGLLDWIAQVSGLAPVVGQEFAQLARRAGLPDALFDDEVGARTALRRMGAAYEGPLFEATPPRPPAAWGRGVVDPAFVSYGGADGDELGLLLRGTTPVVWRSHETNELTWVAESRAHLLRALARIEREPATEDDDGVPSEVPAEHFEAMLGRRGIPAPGSDEQAGLDTLRQTGDPALLLDWYRQHGLRWHEHSLRHQLSVRPTE